MTHYLNALKPLVLVILGTFFMALAINGVLLPHYLFSGGLTGVANLLYFLFGWHMSTLVIVLNIPLFILAYFFLSKAFIGYSLLGILSLSLWLKVSEGLLIHVHDTLSIILVGGTLVGIGCGLIYRGGGSTGGSDIIAKIINKYFSISMATVSFVVNGSLILLFAFFFGLDSAVLSVAIMYVSSKVIFFIMDGIHVRRTLFIVTTAPHHKAIAHHMVVDLGRGVTVLSGEGDYNQGKRYIIYAVVGIQEVAKAKRLISLYDPNAFVTISHTAQVIGRGKGFLRSLE